jgi:calcineurin-like phosphoesterase family protein
VQLDHLPYVADSRHEGRYAEYRPTDEGLWLLHGHVHSTPAERLRPRQLDVGVDGNGYKPLHIDEVIAIIQRTGAG